MANLITEGFDWLPAAWPGSSTMESMISAAGFHLGGVEADMGTVLRPATGRFGDGRALEFRDGGDQYKPNGYILLPFTEYLEEGYLGFALYTPSQITGGSTSHNGGAFVQIWDGANLQEKFFLYINVHGAIFVVRGAAAKSWTWYPDGGPPAFTAANLISNTPSGAVMDDVWQFIEVYFKIGKTDGAVQVRVNTVIKIDAVDVDTDTLVASPKRPGEADSVAFGYVRPQEYSNVWFTIDDLYLNDTTGAVNNDFLGNVRVKSQFPIGNGANIDFSIGGSAPAATNWQSVLNFNRDDTKYVYSITAGDFDLYDLDPTLNSPLIHVVQARMSIRMDDSTQRQMGAVIRLGGVNYDSPETYYINQNYSYAGVKWELNPATGVSFTGAEMNGAEAGPKVVV